VPWSLVKRDQVIHFLESVWVANVLFHVGHRDFVLFGVRGWFRYICQLITVTTLPTVSYGSASDIHIAGCRCYKTLCFDEVLDEEGVGNKVQAARLWWLAATGAVVAEIRV